MGKFFKSVIMIAVAFVFMCIINVKSIQAVGFTNENYVVTTDENGEKLYVLDKTEEEIQESQIAKLRQKYEGPVSLLNNEYSYTYTALNTYTTGSNATNYILLGAKYSWAQRSSLAINTTVSFSASATYRALTGSASISMGITDTISFDSNYDSKLGCFGRVRLTKYKITVTDNYTGYIVNTYTDYDVTVLSKAYRPIYAENTGKLFYKYGGTNYYANILKRNMSTPTLTDSDFEEARRSDFV